MAVFLVFGGLLSRGSLLQDSNPGVIQVSGILGNQSSARPSAIAIVNVAQGAEIVDSASVTNSTPTTVPDGNAVSSVGALSLAQNFSSDGEIQDAGQPIGTAFVQSGMMVYKTQKGDTLASLASAFGVSTANIMSENPGMKKTLKPGESLNILPASSVVYQTEDGDTLASISANFNIPQSKILQFNQSVNFSSLDIDTSIIIPGGITANLVASQETALPNFNSDFILPAQGKNMGILSSDNGIDITNSCGTPVVAAADGVVVSDPSISDAIGGWNGGYGNFVLIEHPFGNDIRTRYAHLQQILVQVGTYVKQGQEIGLMGQTGGVSGCQLHFEVIGAQQPFVK